MYALQPLEDNTDYHVLDNYSTEDLKTQLQQLIYENELHLTLDKDYEKEEFMMEFFGKNFELEIQGELKKGNEITINTNYLQEFKLNGVEYFTPVIQYLGFAEKYTTMTRPNVGEYELYDEQKEIEYIKEILHQVVEMKSETYNRFTKILEFIDDIPEQKVDLRINIKEMQNVMNELANIDLTENNIIDEEDTTRTKDEIRIQNEIAAIQQEKILVKEGDDVEPIPPEVQYDNIYLLTPANVIDDKMENIRLRNIDFRPLPLKTIRKDGVTLLILDKEKQEYIPLDNLQLIYLHDSDLGYDDARNKIVQLLAMIYMRGIYGYAGLEVHEQDVKTEIENYIRNGKIKENYPGVLHLTYQDYDISNIEWIE